MISGWAKRIFAAKLGGWTIRRKGEILERGGGDFERGGSAPLAHYERMGVYFRYVPIIS